VTPSPGPLTLNTTSIQFGTANSPISQGVYVYASEYYYGGSFNAPDLTACGSAFTITPDNTSYGFESWYLYSNGVPHAPCGIVFSDNHGQTATLTVSATTTTVVGQ
jgi:hypothetical protein